MVFSNVKMHKKERPSFYSIAYPLLLGQVSRKDVNFLKTLMPETLTGVVYYRIMTNSNPLILKRKVFQLWRTNKTKEPEGAFSAC